VAELKGADGLDEAREAVAHLETASARLELARAHLALAEALHAHGADPAPHHARARELAAACGADGMVRRIDAAGRPVEPAA